MTKATANRSETALDSVEDLLRAGLQGRPFDEEAKLTISRCLSAALADLHSMQLAAEPGSDEARRAADGLQRFDDVLRQIAETGLLPER